MFECYIPLQTGVNEMGWRSDSIDLGGLDFGIGTTSALFQQDGTDPSRMDELNMQQIGLDINPARSCGIQFGIPSGPGALVVSVFISTCSTSVMLITYLFGTSRSVIAGGAGNGSKCEDTE